MSFWKKTMDYLGLGPDDAYDDYDEQDEPEPPARQSRSAGDGTSSSAVAATGLAGRARRAVGRAPSRPRPSFPSRDFESPARRSRAGRGPATTRAPSARPAGRRAARAGAGAERAEPSTVRPRRFDQAQEVADKFKDGQPVIMNLEGAEREVARRLIDFASGICYALDGSMEKVATGVYLLKPAPRAASHRFDDYES